MKQFSILAFTLLFIQTSSGQIGLELATTHHNVNSEASNPVSGNNLDDAYQSFELGINYWLRLKNYRLEFLPGVKLGFGQNKVAIGNIQDLKFNELTAQINVTTQIYPFSFKDDCNCPTFKKTGNFFTKGFHFIIQPAYIFSHRSFTPETEAYLNNQQLFAIGLGAGLDFGLSKLWTLSPSIIFAPVFGDHYLSQEVDGSRTSITHHALSIGLKLMYRRDYKKRY